MQSEPLLRPGELLERRYRLGPMLAFGGFGQVYEAYDIQLERRVALKYIFLQLDIAQLQNEVKILAAHAERLLFMPNVYSFWQGRGGSGFFIVMEFVEGPTLKQSEPHPWPAARVEKFLRALLGNLVDLQRHGIIHCDIKPVNIKATPDYQRSISVPYRLLDFGIARQSGQTVIAGASPNYSAPEQHGLGASRLDHRVDLYALGATAYFLLTGHKPADARDRFTALSRGEPDKLRPPASFGLKVPPGLVATVLDLLELDRERRPPDAAAALALLEQRLAPIAPAPQHPAVVQPARGTELVDQPQLPDVPPTLISRIQPGPIKGKDATPPDQRSTAGQSDRDVGPNGRTPALPPAAASTASRPATLLHRQGCGVITGLAWAPDGETLLIGSTLGIYRYQLADGSCTLWHPSDSPIQTIAITDGGRQLIFYCDNHVWLRPLAGDQQAEIVKLALEGGRLLSAPLASALAIVGNDTLRMTDLSQPADEVAWELPPRLLGRVTASSADGQVIAFGVDNQLSIFSLPGEHQQLAGLPEPLGDLALSASGEVAAVVGADTLAVWQSGDAAAQLFAQPGARRVALSHDGELIAVAADGGVSLLLSYDGRPLPALDACELENISFLAFCPRDQLLAAATPGELRIWRLTDRSLIGQRLDFGAVGSWLAPGADAAFVSAGLAMQKWTVADGTLVLTASMPLDQPSIALAAMGLWVASAEGGTVVLHNRATLDEVGRLQLQPAQQHGLALGPGGETLLVVGADRITLCATTSAEQRHELLLGDRGTIEHVVFSADARRVAVHSRGGVSVYMLADGVEFCAVRSRAPSALTALALSPDGSQLVVAFDHALACWELNEGRVRSLWQQAIDGPAPHHLAFSEDSSRLLALQGKDATIWQLRAAGIDPQPTRCPHNDRVHDALLLDAGQWLVTSSADGALRLWSLEQA